MNARKSTLKTIGEGSVGAAKVFFTLVLAPLLRSGYNRKGVTDEELTRSLPGDESVPRPRIGYTRAITIQAPASEIWPWLVQIGQGRGGLYSYDQLENLVGCDIHSADRIAPELQNLKIGDAIRLTPEPGPFFEVVGIEPCRALILKAGTPPKAENAIRADDGYPTGASWVFLLDEREDGTTQLITRSRTDYPPTLANNIIWRAITEPINYVMEQKMLRGIKERAEDMATMR